MGCCVSTQNGATTSRHRHSGSPPSNRYGSKSPPTAEEEAVKEVLSETPHKPTKIQSPNPNPYYYTPIPKINHTSTTSNGFPMAVLPTNHKLYHSPRKQPKCPQPTDPKLLSPPSPGVSLPMATAPDEISEVSEISCLSESVSVATAADPDGEVRQRVPRSPSPGRIHKTGSFPADPAVRRERLTGKSPVRRSDPSSRRTGPDREGGQVVRNRGGGFGVGDGQRRREPGENSGRRSRSPVARSDVVANRANVGRSPSARRTGLSPGRVRMVQQGSGVCDGDGCGRKMEEENGGAGGMESSWETNPTAPGESLENPLVSLECFIFL